MQNNAIYGKKVRVKITVAISHVRITPATRQEDCSVNGVEGSYLGMTRELFSQQLRSVPDAPILFRSIGIPIFNWRLAIDALKLTIEI